MEGWVAALIGTSVVGVVQICVVAFSYGKLWQKVDDLSRDVSVVRRCPTCNEAALRQEPAAR